MDGFHVRVFCFWVRFVRGFGVKRSIAVVAAILVSGGLLVGCAGAEAGVESVTDAGGGGEVSQQSGADQSTAAGVAPRGFEFESGFLEFGGFDPYAIGDDIFNPCTEISEQEFAAAGFEQMQYDDGNNPFSQGIASCDFGGVRADGAISGFHVGVINRAIAEEQNLVLSGYTSDLLPELYVTRPVDNLEGVCFAQVDTVRGAFTAHAGGPKSRVDRDQACAMAIENVEKVFLAYGPN